MVLNKITTLQTSSFVTHKQMNLMLANAGQENQFGLIISMKMLKNSGNLSINAKISKARIIFMEHGMI